MQIPKVVKVGGIKYKVEIVGSNDLGEDTSASVSLQKTRIKLTSGDPQFMKQSFWHEVFHCINIELAEETVEYLAQAVYQVIADNPKIFEGGEQRHDNNRE